MGSRLLVVGVCLLVAGCTSLGGTASETVTPAPVPEDSSMENPRQLAPGLTTETVVNPRALATAHTEALENRSYTLKMRWLSDDRVRRSIIEVEHARLYHYRSETGADSSSAHVFANGRLQYSKSRRPLGVEYETAQAVPVRERLIHSTGRLVRGYLSVGRTTVDVRETDSGDHYFEIRTAAYAPRQIDGAREYTARAVVMPTGLVRSLTIRYRTAENTMVGYRFEYTAINETTIDRPEWVTEQWQVDTSTDDGAESYDSN